MKRVGFVATLLLAVGVAFVAGSRFGHGPTKGGGPPVRKILYYVDPMHPSYKSDKPGIAPDCGMQLEPVYEDGGPSGAGGAPLPAGTVTVTPEQQQVLGVRVAAVEKAAVTQTVRVLGKVVADERRTYVITAPVDGWVQNTAGNSTGSLVRKDEILAHFYSPDLGALVRSLMFSLGSRERALAPGEKFPSKTDLSLDTVAGLRNQRDAQQLDILRNLGLGERQIEDLVEKRQWTGNVEIASPDDGFIIYRNVSEGVRLAKGAEMFRIANLEKVWIVADVYGDEVTHFRPGMTIRGTAAELGRVFTARVTDILPQFDAATRTMKVRLEASNPGYLLRPDMFVDLEVPVRYAPALNVPADAVMDGGTRKTVFVEREKGVFEPREVETGWQSADRVQIVHGLSAGERIVVSGNFLVDSESRMKKAAAGIYGASRIDPVCGMEVDEARAKAAGRTFDYKGKTYFLCSDDCLDKLRKEPSRYLRAPAEKSAVGTASMSDAERAGHGMPHDGHMHEMRAPAPAPPPSAPERKAAPQKAMSSMPAAEGPPRTMPMELRRGMRLEQPAVPPGTVAGRTPAMPHAGQDMPATPAASRSITPELAIDPVCLMPVDAVKAKAEGRTFTHNDAVYYFCSDDCREKFRKAPATYIKLPDAGKKPSAPPSPTRPMAAPPAPAPMPPGGMPAPPAVPTGSHGTHAMPPSGRNAAPPMTAPPPPPPMPPGGMPAPPAPPAGVPVVPPAPPGTPGPSAVPPAGGASSFVPPAKSVPVTPVRLPTDRRHRAVERPDVADGLMVEYVDPVCGKTVSAGRVTLYRGKTYYFCDDSCKRRFDENPEAFIHKADAPERSGAAETLPAAGGR